MNETIYLVQIILGMFLWLNFMIAFTVTRQLILIEPFPANEGNLKYLAYLIMLTLMFFLWPLGVIKLNK